MRHVTNCILIHQGDVLFIRKPSRGWYSVPGGKMEPGETVRESIIREYREETGLHLIEPTLAGVFSFTEPNLEWMMHTFISHTFEGTLNEFCEEGELEWVKIEEIPNLPMAEGDYKIFEHLLKTDQVVYGAFKYTKDRELLEHRIDSSIS